MSPNDSSSANPAVAIGSQTVRDGGIGVKIEMAGSGQVLSTLSECGPLFGRVREMVAIEDVFREPQKPARLILSGEPGIGKTHLANAYGVVRRDRYPGGTFLVEFDADPALGLARLIPPSHGESTADTGLRFLRSMHRPTLLIYDNVPSEAVLGQWLPGAGLPVHLLVTSTSGDWSHRQVVHHLQPLDDADSRALVQGVCGPDLAKEYGEVLVRRAAGIAVQLLADCMAMEYESRHGRVPSLVQSLAEDTRSSFLRAFGLLPVESQLAMRVAALFNPARIPRTGLLSALRMQGWEPRVVDAAVDGAIDRRLLSTAGDFMRMHSLVIQFVRARKEPVLPDSITSMHRSSFVGDARLFTNLPGNIHIRERLACFPASIAEWDEIGIRLHPVDCHSVGHALADMGRFVEAIGWLRRALSGKADGHNQPIDHASLGSTAHELGYCLGALGQYDGARECYERAVAEKATGDLKGRVDHESLSASLRLVAACWVEVGAPAEAMPWWDRAAAELEMIDSPGSVDGETRGMLQDQIGVCLLGQRRPEEARLRFENALELKTAGNIQRRVDRDSLSRSLRGAGRCWLAIENFERAMPLFERAVLEAQAGDIHGRIHHQHIAHNMERVAFCLSSTKEYTQAMTWLQRAMSEEAQGDIHGRVDYENLGAEMQEMGYCLLNLGQTDSARLWYERAVITKEKGDIFGDVHHDSIALSSHQVGYCLWAKGQFEAARPHFERAVEEEAMGDHLGRVDLSKLRTSLNSLGRCLVLLGRGEAAQPYLLRAANLTAITRGG